MTTLADFATCEEFVPAFPWDEFERKWLCETVKNAIKAVEDGKRNVDCRRNQEAGRITQKSRRKKRGKDSRKGS